MNALRVSHLFPVANDFLNTGDTFHRNLRFARSHRYPREGTLGVSKFTTLDTQTEWKVWKSHGSGAPGVRVEAAAHLLPW